MNGKTMLNGVPYFSDAQVIELTRAEYDALPNSKYTDGVLYCIKDEGVMKGDTFSPIIYSLAEREVGVWVDGKPLYQICINYNNNIPAGWTTLYTGENTMDIKLCTCLFTHTTSNTSFGVNHYVRNSEIYFTTQVIESVTGSGVKNQIKCYNAGDTRGYALLILQYTKTTDNPGTGKWTTSGVPAHHYSTEEQVIGTWIDGKTLYEKTIVETMTSSAKKLELSSECIIHSVYGGVSDNSNNKFVAFGFVTTSNDYVRTYQEFEGGTNGLYIQNSYYSTRPKVTVTIQYTKTTD